MSGPSLFIEDMASHNCLGCGQPATLHVQWNGEFYCKPPVMVHEETIEAIANAVVEKISTDPRLPEAIRRAIYDGPTKARPLSSDERTAIRQIADELYERLQERRIS